MKPIKTHHVFSFLLIAYVVLSPYDLLALPLSGEMVDLPQLLIIVVGFLLLLRARKQIKLPMWGAEALIVIGSMIAIVDALNRVEAIETLGKDIYMFLFFIIVINMVEDREILMKMIRIWLFIAIFQGALVFGTFVSQTGQPEPSLGQQASELGLELEGDSTQEIHAVKRATTKQSGIFVPGRQRGTFSNSNLAGLYLAQSAILAMGVPFTKRRWLRWGGIGMMIAGLAATGSNSTLGALLGATFLFVLFNSSSRMRIFWFGASALGAGALMALLIVLPPDKLAVQLAQLSTVFEQGVSRVPDSAGKRTDMVISGWKQYREVPLGLAPHGMRESEADRNVHNDYASYLFERGYLGFMGLMTLFGGITARALYSAFTSDDPKHRSLILGLLGVVAVTAVTELAHEYMREREIWLTMAMIVLFARFELEKRQAYKQEVQVKLWPWAVPQLLPEPQTGSTQA